MERPIFWRQGLFLQPQHLQLADRYTQTATVPIYRYLQEYAWGVGRFEIQAGALETENFTLVQGEFLFQDHTLASFPGNAVIEARSFGDAWEDGGRPFDVYVGLRKWSESGTNVTVSPHLGDLAEVGTRFVTTTDPEDIEDLHHDGPPAQVQRLHHVLKIVWETEKAHMGDYHLIPLARLERRGEKVVVAETHVPPCLALEASPVLQKLAFDIKDRVSARGRQMEALKRDRGIQSAAFGSKDMVYLLALRSINRYIPILEQLTATGRTHPCRFYEVLRQMVGEFSTFSERVDVLGTAVDGVSRVRSYDHENLWACFDGAVTTITRLLDDITAGPEYSIQLLYDGAYFAAELPVAVFEGRKRFYLVCETELDPQHVLQALAGISKLSTRETLPILIARALPGVRLDHLEVPPQELPRRAGAIYCQIDHHSDQWGQVREQRNLALYWDEAPEDLRLELMVVGRE